MSGKYITQSRSLNDFVTRETRLAHWAQPNFLRVAARSVTQTTTSFRSGSRYSEYPDLEGTTPVKRNGSFDTGYEFDTLKDSILTNYPLHKVASSDGRNYMIQPLMIDYTLMSFLPSVPPWPKVEADVIGSKFIRDTVPTKPSAALATSVGEILSEGRIASIIGSTTLSSQLSVFRKAGSEYLNVVFGWLPFVAAITEVLEAVGSSEKIISQFIRDSGKNVRRKRSYTSDNVYEPLQVYPNRQLIYPSSGFGAYLEPDTTLRSGTATVNQWKKTKYSFSAAYTYYLDTGGDFYSDLKRFEQLANKLLGTRITPEVLWELVPFSWLVDWMWSTGIYVSNYSSFNGDELVLRYGYVMRHVEHMTQITLPGLSFGGKKLGTVLNVRSSVRKSRVQSTPYGFGQNPSSFTGAQWAILAALGMTKAPNKLARFSV